jgi:hypothetical protein
MERERKGKLACTIVDNHFLCLCLTTWPHHVLDLLDCLFACAIGNMCHIYEQAN